MRMRDELKSLTWKLLDATVKDRGGDDLYFKILEKPLNGRVISLPYEITSEYVRAIQVLRRKAKAQAKFLSDSKIEDLLDDFIMDLKYSTSTNINNEIDKRITELFDKIGQSPNERHVFLIPIVNLAVNGKVTVGDSTIFRLTPQTFSELQKEYGLKFHSPSRKVENVMSDLKRNETDIFIKVLIDAADKKKAEEMAFEKAETVLNVLRLYSLDENVSLRGEEYAKVSRMIMSANLDKKALSRSHSSVNFVPIPLHIDKKYAESMLQSGLKSINSLLTHEVRTLTDLQKNLLTAIFWFGGAVRDKRGVSKFLKYIVAIETLLLRGERSKKEPISKRLATVIYKDAARKEIKEAYQLMKHLYQVRNDIIHAGLDYVEPEDIAQAELWCRALIFSLVDYADAFLDIIPLIEKEFQVNDEVFV